MKASEMLVIKLTNLPCSQPGFLLLLSLPQALIFRHSKIKLLQGNAPYSLFPGNSICTTRLSRKQKSMCLKTQQPLAQKLFPYLASFFIHHCPEGTELSPGGVCYRKWQRF
jgi:hypothetical protein